MSGSTKTYCVYKHTAPNGKVYVGITCQKPESRWRNGENYNSNQLFTRAIKKYGWDKIAHEVLFSGLAEENAKQMEIKLIADLRARDRKYGYNLTAGGDGMAGFVTREETKHKLSAINKGKHHTQETRKRMSAARAGEKAYWYGKNLTAETKEKISESHKGRYDGEKNPMFGRKMSDASRSKMSKNHADITGKNNPRARRVVQYDVRGNHIKTHDTITDAALCIGCSYSTMQRYLINKRNDPRGFVWKYVT